MLKKIKQIWYLIKYGNLFPNIVKNFWGACCAGWNEDNTDEVFPYWNIEEDNHGYHRWIDHSFHEIVPLYVREGMVAFYEIIEYERTFGDNAGWDDGRKYRLRLHHIEKNNERFKPYIKK